MTSKLLTCGTEADLINLAIEYFINFPLKFDKFNFSALSTSCVVALYDILCVLVSKKALWGSG